METQNANKTSMRAMVEDYLTYIERDTSLSSQARNDVVTDAASFFLAIGSAYRDESVVRYVKGYEHPVSEKRVAESPRSRYVSKKEPHIKNERQRKPAILSAAEVADLPRSERIAEMAGFKSLDRVMAELRIDKRTLAGVLEKINFKVEVKNTSGGQVECVSMEVYSDIRRYVRSARR